MKNALLIGIVCLTSISMATIIGFSYGLFSNRSKNRPNPMHKYVERRHWDQLIKNFNFAKQGELDQIVSAGLKFENNLRHTGDTILLFDAFFAMHGPNFCNKKRALAELFCQQHTFRGFDEVDIQYLIDVAAVALRVNCWEESKHDKIHKLANLLPNLDGVNPLIGTRFRIEQFDANGDKNSNEVVTSKLDLFQFSNDSSPSLSEFRTVCNSSTLKESIEYDRFVFEIFSSSVDRFCEQNKLLNVCVRDSEAEFYGVRHFVEKDNSPVVGITIKSGAIILHHWRGFATYLDARNFKFLKQEFTK